MKNIPEKIYLIIGDECPTDANFKDLREVTWSSNSNFKNDIEYILATEDKKAPVDEDETAESVLLRRGVHYTIPNEIKTVTVKSALQAMKEFGSQERNRAIQEILKLDQPWPLDNVLKKLIEASAILLDKGYDGHGWEEIHGCIVKGKEILEDLEKLKKQP